MKKLFAFRVRRGMTLQDLSNLTGISVSTLNRIERGLRKCSNRTKVIMQDKLNISPDELNDLLQDDQGTTQNADQS